MKSGIPVNSSRIYSDTETLAGGTHSFQITSPGTGYNAASTSLAKSVRIQ